MDSTKHVFIAGYVRVSSMQQVKAGSSLSDQKKSIETYASSTGCEIYKIYTDEGISGTKANRPALQQMKEDAKKGLFQEVVFTHIDRFGRSAEDLLSNYKYFETLNITVYSIHERLSTKTPVGRLMRTLLVAMAEMERELIRERTMVGRLARLEQGINIGTCPFGYNWNRTLKKFEICEEQARIYQRIVHEYLVKGKSQRMIATDLNNEGIKSRYGKKWDQKVIGLILYNPAYKGHFRYTYQGHEFSFRVPPLITQKEWTAIRKQAEENINNPHRKIRVDDPFLLRNLLTCGECNSGVYPFRVKNRVARYYTCHSAQLIIKGNLLPKGSLSCSQPLIYAQEIENAVLNIILQESLYPSNIAGIWPKRVDSSEEEALNKFNLLSSRLAFFKTKKEEYFTLLSEGQISKDDFKKRKRPLERRVKYLEYEADMVKRRFTLIQDKKREGELGPPDDIQLTEIATNIQKACQKLTNAQLKGLFQEAVGNNRLRVLSCPRNQNAIRTLPETANPGREGEKEERLPLPGDSLIIEGLSEMNFRAAFQYLCLFLNGQI
jgi:site-specific DNA recombinase